MSGISLQSQLAALEMQLRETSAQVTTLDKRLIITNARLKSRTRALWAAMFVAAVVLLLVLAAAIRVQLDNRHDIEANNAKFCPLLGLMIVKPPSPPSTTARGRYLDREARRLAERLGCPSSTTGAT